MKRTATAVAPIAIVIIFLSLHVHRCPAQETKLPVGNAAADLPVGAIFVPPAPNECTSRYDRYYAAEPGVYAYWALCEPGNPAQIYDYVGQFDLTAAAHSFGSGNVSGGAAGPVNDGETGARVSTGTVSIVNQGIPLNSHQGTIAAWISAESANHAVSAAFFSAVGGKSAVSISLPPGDSRCFEGNYVNSSNKPFAVRKCADSANAWHRVVFTWRDGNLSLSVDGEMATSVAYEGTLENKIYYYRLFPGCCNTGTAMTLAKVLIANQAWSPAQIKQDFAPHFPNVPPQGVYISSQTLGTIHRDVLGFADDNQDISSPALRKALLAGLTAAGLTSVRYGGGYGGIEADLENWKGGPICTKTMGETSAARNIKTANTLETFYSEIAKIARLDIVYTVNYGTNPPLCNGGGDPIANGADLVQYANVDKHMGIRHWEIGNEVPAASTETDLHPDPHSGRSYITYEPSFYREMKYKDPGIEIAVPIGLATYQWQVDFDLPVLEHAMYDAVVWHNYPMRDPITDGDTLYQERVTANMHRTRGSLLKLQTELLNNGKRPDAIWITEWNGEVSGNKWTKQTMGAVTPLFVASQLAEYMQAGVRFATWWVQGKPNGCSTLNYDGQGDSSYSWWRCGSTALVYAGPTLGHGEVAIGQRPGNLTPAGRAFQILSQSGFVTEGEHMLDVQADTAAVPWLLTYAATHGHSCAVILINRDRDHAHTVPVKVADKDFGKSVQQWSYGRTQYDRSHAGDWSVGPVRALHGSWSGVFEANLPPWSISVLIFD